MLHPWHLAWAHRPLLKSQVQKYDVFMYNEDDILISQNNIDYWFEYYPFISSFGMDLGFIRVETDDEGNEFVVDLHHGEKHQNGWKYENSEFAILRKNYRGFWLYDKRTTEYFSNTSGFCSMPNYIHDARENAARGLQKPQTKTVVPIINKKLHEHSKVYHLTNNYWNNKNTPHGKVPFHEALSF